jgi:hypothetical protein
MDMILLVNIGLPEVAVVELGDMWAHNLEVSVVVLQDHMRVLVMAVRIIQHLPQE